MSQYSKKYPDYVSVHTVHTNAHNYTGLRRASRTLVRPEVRGVSSIEADASSLNMSTFVMSVDFNVVNTSSSFDVLFVYLKVEHSNNQASQ